jgi:hypothetical protein
VSQFTFHRRNDRVPCKLAEEVRILSGAPSLNLGLVFPFCIYSVWCCRFAEGVARIGLLVSGWRTSKTISSCRIPRPASVSTSWRILDVGRNARPDTGIICAGSPMRVRSASRHWPQPRSRIHTLTSPRCTWTFPIRPTLFIYSGAWHSISVPPVCTENLVRIDLMRESLNVGHDGRADISLRAGLYKDRANKANVKIGQRKCHITST